MQVLARRHSTRVPERIDYDPHELIVGRPDIHFYWKEDNRGKRRLFGNPNKAARATFERFEAYVREGIWLITSLDDRARLQKLPSATGSVKGSNHILNAEKHMKGGYFYITDLSSAYPSIDLRRLATLLVYIKKFDVYGLDISLNAFNQDADALKPISSDPLYERMLSFLESFCSGIHGEGLAIGSTISPFLLNLFCEAYIDFELRKICKVQKITYTRYVDDLVFSSESHIIGEEVRRKIRKCLERAGLRVSHKKSKVQMVGMGTVFVTKSGLREDEERSKSSVLVFPQRKRRRLHGIIGCYLAWQMDSPEVVSGYVAEFIYYFKKVERPTASDRKTFELCKKFEVEYAKYRKF